MKSIVLSGLLDKCLSSQCLVSEMINIRQNENITVSNIVKFYILRTKTMNALTYIWHSNMYHTTLHSCIEQLETFF